MENRYPNQTQKHLVHIGLILVIILSVLSIIGEKSLDEVSQHLPPFSNQLAQLASLSDGLVWSGSGTVSVADSSVLDGMSNLTISSCTDQTQVGSVEIASKRHTGAPYASYSLATNATNQPVFSTVNAGQGYVTVRGNTALLTNQKNHIAGVYDGSSMHIYVNGSLDDAYSRTQSGTIFDSNGALVTNYQSHLSGTIYDARVYSRALSLDEIRQLASDCTGNALSSGQSTQTETTTNPPATPSPETIPPTGQPSQQPTQQATPATPPTGPTISVKKDGTGDYSTIQECATVAQPGQSCVVYPGIYDERVTMSRSGTANQPIIMQTSGSGVIVRGFRLLSASYVRIIGFEITHGDIRYAYPGIELSASHGAQILNNYIHDTSTTGIRLPVGAPSNNVLIRGNRLTLIGVVPGHAIGEAGMQISGNDILIEGNDISRVGDFTNVWGDRNVIRNNHFHDVRMSYFPDYMTLFAGADPQGHHLDGLQFFSNSTTIPLRYALYEGNLIDDLASLTQTHGVILRNVANDPSHDFIYRYNHLQHTGGSTLLVTEFDNVRMFNNTFEYVCEAVAVWNCGGMINAATGGAILNNIFVMPLYPSGGPTGRRGYEVDASSQPGFRGDYNLAYQPGYSGAWSAPIASEAHAVVNRDPLLSSGAVTRSGSPAIDAGGPLTTATGAGNNSTVLQVSDAGFFQDGWAGVTPDRIAVGSAGNSAQISSINYTTNTITLRSPLTWSTGAPIYLHSKSDGTQVLYGSAPDIGAFEYNNGTTYTPPQTPVVPTQPTGTSADFNHDGAVNTLDFSLMVSAWNTTSSIYDLNHDNTVNTLDYSIMAGQWTR